MRPIDADALRKGLNNAIAQVTANTGVRGIERETFLETMVFALRMIDEAEPLDVAQVVRCKDCVYAKPMPDRGVPKFGVDALNCTACRGDDGYGFCGISVVCPDDYCSDGAKMDGDRK